MLVKIFTSRIIALFKDSTSTWAFIPYKRGMFYLVENKLYACLCKWLHTTGSCPQASRQTSCCSSTPSGVLQSLVRDTESYQNDGFTSLVGLLSEIVPVQQLSWSLMSIFGHTFNTNHIDLCIKSQCNIYIIYIHIYIHISWNMSCGNKLI